MHSLDKTIISISQHIAKNRRQFSSLGKRASNHLPRFNNISMDYTLSNSSKYMREAMMMNKNYGVGNFTCRRQVGICNLSHYTRSLEHKWESEVEYLFYTHIVSKDDKELQRWNPWNHQMVEEFQTVNEPSQAVVDARVITHVEEEFLIEDSCVSLSDENIEQEAEVEIEEKIEWKKRV
ncbi:hypothetical protein M9H77_06833 [Catharanthus roseus]|uniref:Uncharacterized protein n=1 Tax=Catharanthus roseus TaxID=4058 RepID=A0ACC0BTM3_CATRO|nr:hypothetical protein M9H77_06833 [Catharanthus roseus]